jgi:uncharacterized membrane protein
MNSARPVEIFFFLVFTATIFTLPETHIYLASSLQQLGDVFLQFLNLISLGFILPFGCSEQLSVLDELVCVGFEFHFQLLKLDSHHRSGYLSLI